jgi:hypothetical protein
MGGLPPLLGYWRIGWYKTIGHRQAFRLVFVRHPKDRLIQSKLDDDDIYLAGESCLKDLRQLIHQQVKSVKSMSSVISH